MNAGVVDHLRSISRKNNNGGNRVVGVDEVVGDDKVVGAKVIGVENVLYSLM